MKDKVSAAHMAQSELENAKKNLCNLLHIANADHVATNNELREVREMLKEAKEDTHPQQDYILYLTRWRNNLCKKLLDIANRKTLLQEKSDALMAAKPLKQVQAFYQQVGAFDPTQREEAYASTLSDKTIDLCGQGNNGQNASVSVLTSPESSNQENGNDDTEKDDQSASDHDSDILESDDDNSRFSQKKTSKRKHSAVNLNEDDSDGEYLT